MKLLFDHNLSPKLVTKLDDLFPESAHVFQIGLDREGDDVIWAFARENDFTLVTKDADFEALSVLMGSPPKVIWLRVGNCTTDTVERVMRWNFIAVQAFESDPNKGLLVLY